MVTLAELCALAIERHLLFYTRQDLEQLCNCPGDVFQVCTQIQTQMLKLIIQMITDAHVHAYYTYNLVLITRTFAHSILFICYSKIGFACGLGLDAQRDRKTEVVRAAQSALHSWGIFFCICCFWVKYCNEKYRTCFMWCIFGYLCLCWVFGLAAQRGCVQPKDRKWCALLGKHFIRVVSACLFTQCIL